MVLTMMSIHQKWHISSCKLALKNAAKKCGPVLLEPIMAVEVTAPSEYLGSVMGDISSRRGMIEGQEERGNAVSVQASVPLSEMFGYATDLRSFTQGRGNYTMQLIDTKLHLNQLEKKSSRKMVEMYNLH